MPDQPPPEELQNPSPIPQAGQIEGDFGFLGGMVPKDTGSFSGPSKPMDFGVSNFDSFKPQTSTTVSAPTQNSSHASQAYDSNWATKQATKPQNILTAISVAEKAERMGGPKMETTFGYANKAAGGHLNDDQVKTVAQGSRQVNSWAQQNNMSKDPFQGFGGFGQPQTNSQASSGFQNWDQQQKNAPAGGAWDDLDKAISNYSGMGITPTTNPKPQTTNAPTSQQNQSNYNNPFGNNPWKGSNQSTTQNSNTQAPQRGGSYGGPQQAPVSQQRQASISSYPTQSQQQGYGGSQGGYNQNASVGGTSNTYNTGNNNMNSGYSSTYGSTTDNYSGNTGQEAPPEEKKPVYEGNNPMRFINMPSGMSALRGKR